MSSAYVMASPEILCSIMAVTTVVGRLPVNSSAIMSGLRSATADAYEQFERMKGITLFGYLTHARKKFTEVLDENIALATQALCHINKLYKVESEADKFGLSIEECKEKCIRESYPVIPEFERWMQDAYLKVLPKSRSGNTPSHFFPNLPDM